MMGKRKKTKTPDADVVELDPNLLTLDPDVQPREKVTQTLVGQYSEDMEDGDVFPPVVVYSDGKSHWVADGFHRVGAAIKAGLTTIKVEVRKGGKRDAILFAVGSNAIHGCRRTNADKRRAVTALLKDDEWSGWADREIARRCHVSDRFVNKLRAELSANGSQMGRTRKVTRGGKNFPMDTTKIGSRGGDEEEEQQDEDGSAGVDDPGSGSADPADLDDLDELGHQPGAESDEPSESEELSAEDVEEDGLTGVLGDILEEVLHDGGDDEEVESDDEVEVDGNDVPDDEVVPDGDDAPHVRDDEPDEVGGTTDSTDTDDNYSPSSEPAPPLDAAASMSPGRWALVKVSADNFDDQQADAVREHLEDGSYSHVLVVKTSPGSTGYPAYGEACEVVQEAGYPLQFQGHLVLAGNHMVWATVACRDEGLENQVELVRLVLGWGTVGMEEIPVGGDGDG